jgi:hypothetical protein
MLLSLKKNMSMNPLELSMWASGREVSDTVKAS